jgi:PAS domain S-box-containing protein
MNDAGAPGFAGTGSKSMDGRAGSTAPLRVLLLEDLPADAELLVRELKRAGLRVAHQVVETEAAFRAALRDFQPDLILADFFMPHFDGMWALELAREFAPDVPFIFVSRTISEEYPMRALRKGAADYVLKNNLVRLPVAVERALKAREEAAARRIADARHRATFDNAPIGIMHAAIDDDRILLVNPKLVELLGYTQNELLGMKTSDILPDERGWDRGKYGESMLKGELDSFASEQRLVRKDGSDFRVNLTVSLVRDAAGKPLSFIRMVSPVPASEEALLSAERCGDESTTTDDAE